MILARGSGLGVRGIVCLGIILGASAIVVAQDYEAAQSRSRKPASGWATKKEVDLDAVVEEKLKQVLKNQQLILQKADAVKQELEVIKVRVSMRRSRTRSDTDVQ